jgi:polygalacturonase
VLNFDRCINLTIHKVTVDSDDYWNNDGIDIGDCRNVRITDCYINSADDGICLKSHHAGSFNDSIYIANCTVRSSASAIKFGTASLGGFKNVKIENIYIFDSFRSAIALESVDGGILENIEISDITANNTGNAIFIKLGHRNTDGKIGTLKNVKIKDVVVQVPFGAPDLKYEIRGPELPFFHNTFPASITG